MAEIRVEERKRGMGWLWGLIALVIVALLIWYFLNNADTAADGTVRDTLGMLMEGHWLPALPTRVA